MAWKSGRDDRSWQRVLDDGYEDDASRGPVGFSVHKPFPIIKSYGPGGPTYQQLKWALTVIRLYNQGVPAREWPSEESFTKAKGVYRYGRKDRDERRTRTGAVDEQRSADSGNAAAAPQAEPEARAEEPAVDHLPQVQERRRHVPPRRPRRERPHRVRPR